MNDFEKKSLDIHRHPFIVEKVKKIRNAISNGSGRSIGAAIKVSVFVEMISKGVDIKDLILDPKLLQTMHSNDKSVVESVDEMISKGLLREDLTSPVSANSLTPIPLIIGIALSAEGFKFGIPQTTVAGKRVIDKYQCKKDGKSCVLYFDSSDILLFSLIMLLGASEKKTSLPNV